MTLSLSLSLSLSTRVTVTSPEKVFAILLLRVYGEADRRVVMRIPCAGAARLEPPLGIVPNHKALSLSLSRARARHTSGLLASLRHVGCHSAEEDFVFGPTNK
jgi:hypothetical protein